jgi:hypothetical protein
MDIKELADRTLLKELVDRVVMLGDQKDFDNQLQLFTEDALSETFSGGKPVLTLKGRKAMAAAFSDFLKDFETIYHFNGQQVVTMDGDRAIGTCYCLITLIGNENGRKIKTSIGAIYQDDYIREDRRWLIAKRTGTFEWQEKSEVVV